MAYMLKRQDGFRLFLDNGRVDIGSNLVENAFRSPAMNRHYALFASLIGTCKMNGAEPCAYLRDLFTKLANGHLARNIDALVPWACAHQGKDTQGPRLVVPDERPDAFRAASSLQRANAKSMARSRR
jgi:transposase